MLQVFFFFFKSVFFFVIFPLWSKELLAVLLQQREKSWGFLVLVLNFGPLSLLCSIFLLIIFFTPPPHHHHHHRHPSSFFLSANSPHPAKPALALHWGAREEREKKKTGAGDFFFHFKRCAKFMMRVQNGNYQAVCLPLAVCGFLW